MKTFKEITKEIIEDSKAGQVSKNNERLKKQLNITDKDIKIAQKALSKHYKVKPKFVVFYAIWDMGFKDIVDLTFNILDPKHKFFKSTKHYRWNPKEERGIQK